MHFFADDQRVAEEVESLERQDFEAFKRLVIESGHSSFEYLQNIHTADDPRSQSMSLALCLSELLLKDSGAWRVHGGGFGGTTQNFVLWRSCPPSVSRWRRFSDKEAVMSSPSAPSAASAWRSWRNGAA